MIPETAGLPALLARVRSFVPASLLDTTAWDRIAGRVGHLPALPVVRRAGFEMRLSDPAPAADFIVALGTRGELFSYYRDRPPSGAGGPSAALAHVLGEVSARPDEWRWLRGVTLEYDIAAVPVGSRPPPGVFLGLKPGFVAGTQVGGRPAGEAIAQTVADAVGWDRDQEAGQALASVVASMPPQAELMQVGAMPGRGPRLLRITVIFARAGAVADFLTRIRWPGARSEMDPVLGRMADAAPVIFGVSLGVGPEGVDPRLGLEIYRTRGTETLGTWVNTAWDDWRPLVDRLGAEGWCRPEKARGLGDLLRLYRIDSREGAELLYFGLNHLKVSLGSGAIQTKAYAGMRFLPPAATGPRAG